MTDRLIDTALRLVEASPGKPRQADLKRSVSTAYYALFHALARDIADRLVGTGANKSKPAWTQAYRALDHGPAKKACDEVKKLNFPSSIRSCAMTFIDLQMARHAADYDPEFRVSRATARSLIELAKRAIADLREASPKDRTAFAIMLVFKKRT